MAEVPNYPNLECNEMCANHGSNCRSLEVNGAVVGAVHMILAPLLWTKREGPVIVPPDRPMTFRYELDG